MQLKPIVYIKCMLNLLSINYNHMHTLPELPGDEPDRLLLFFNAAASSASFPVGFSGDL